MGESEDKKCKEDIFLTELQSPKKCKIINLPAWIQAITAIGLLIFTYYLTDATIRAVNLSDNSVRIARDTLESGEKTQADTLSEMKAQSKAMQEYARSTKEYIKIAERGIKATEKNIRLIEDQFRLEQRPWLQVVDIRLHSKPEVNKDCWFSFSIVNIGKTPAQQVSIKSYSRIHVKGKPDDFNLMPFDQDNVSIGADRPHEAVFYIGSKWLTGERVKSIESGETIFELITKITYKDVFDEDNLYTTIYCGNYDPKYGLEFLLCKSDNYMK